MNILVKYVLKSIRRTYCLFFSSPRNAIKDCIQDPDLVSEKIYNVLMSDKSCLICRYGSTELNCISNYLSVKKGGLPLLDYITNTYNNTH